MRIRTVRLKNGYKRFRDLTIDLGENPARIVALVGPNGCGKSSVLDGLLYHANAHANSAVPAIAEITRIIRWIAHHLTIFRTLKSSLLKDDIRRYANNGNSWVKRARSSHSGARTDITAS